MASALSRPRRHVLPHHWRIVPFSPSSSSPMCFTSARASMDPRRQQVLEVPIFNTICLLSSSVTIWLAERAIERGILRTFGLWWAATIALGVIFLIGTGLEWYKLIYHDGLTIRHQPLRHNLLFDRGSARNPRRCRPHDAAACAPFHSHRACSCRSTPSAFRFWRSIGILSTQCGSLSSPLCTSWGDNGWAITRGII